MKNKDFIEGVRIIGKHCDPESYQVAVEHDQFWFGSTEEITDEEDIKKLEELGWFIDEDSDAWSAFL